MPVIYFELYVRYGPKFPSLLIKCSYPRLFVVRMTPSPPPNLLSLFHNFVVCGVSELSSLSPLKTFVYTSVPAQVFRKSNRAEHSLCDTLSCYVFGCVNFSCLGLSMLSGLSSGLRVLPKSPLPTSQPGNFLRMVNSYLTCVLSFRAFAWSPIPVIHLLQNNCFTYFVWSFCSFSK